MIILPSRWSLVKESFWRDSKSKFITLYKVVNHLNTYIFISYNFRARSKNTYRFQSSDGVKRRPRLHLWSVFTAEVAVFLAGMKRRRPPVLNPGVKSKPGLMSLSFMLDDCLKALTAGTRRQCRPTLSVVIEHPWSDVLYNVGRFCLSVRR